MTEPRTPVPDVQRFSWRRLRGRRWPWRRVAGRRSRRGASAGGGLFNLTRLAGALLMLAASFTLNWLTAPDQFRLDPSEVTIRGLHYTPAAEAREQLAFDPQMRPNLFRLSTLSIARSLEALPAVASVDVQPLLPDRLVVHVSEREPVLVWQAAGTQMLVDASGAVVSEALTETTELPHVVDRRSGAEPPPLGGQLDSIELAAVLRLAALTPQLLESEATALRLEIDDESGFLLVADLPAWRAVFGHYTPNLRPPSIIDQQVQCLRSLLAQNEAELEVAYLAPSEERCGTFRTRPTPDARIFQNVARQAG